MKLSNIENLRQIKVKVLGPTNNRGTRVCIYEPKRGQYEKTKRVYLPYCYRLGNSQEQALEYLLEKGFNVVSRASELENYIFFCDNWGKDFIELK